MGMHFNNWKNEDDVDIRRDTEREMTREELRQRYAGSHYIHTSLTCEEARLLYAVLWQALSFADNKAYQVNLMESANKESPELRLQADEIGRLSNVMASVLRKFNFQPPQGNKLRVLTHPDAVTPVDESVTQEWSDEVNTQKTLVFDNTPVADTPATAIESKVTIIGSLIQKYIESGLPRVDFEHAMNHLIKEGVVYVWDFAVDEGYICVRFERGCGLTKFYLGALAKRV